MAEKEVKLMKGNEVIAHAAIRYGCDGYFGYPITPQSEVMETLMEEKPWETTGMVVLQAESELASINMVYGGASTGKRVMTSSSSPGISLMSEGLSYLAGAELPCLIVNCQRGGPGLGTIQPSQGDYFQACKGGAHGDFHLIVLAPNSVQEMHDFVGLAFDLAFKYRNPAMILADGVIGQMMEKVVLPVQKPRRTDAEVIEQCPWATTGRTNGRKPNVITSLELKPEEMEKILFINGSPNRDGNTAALAKVLPGWLPVNALRPLVFLNCSLIAMGIVWLLLGLFPKSRDACREQLPGATFNCCVLGTLLVAASQNYNLLQSIGFGFGSGVGYLVAVLVVDEGRRRLRSKDIPHIFRGLPSVLIYIGILSLAIYGLVGTVD